MKVALGFWGLTRSLKYTHESIEKYIFNVLKKNNIDYTIYMHIYNVHGKYSNPRAKERNIILDNDEYKILKADHVLIDDQTKIMEKINMEQYRTKRDPWNTKYKSVDNFILSMYSKTQMTNMIRESGIDYDYVIFLRPDVKYLNKLTLQHLKPATKNTICIPNFHLFKNFNDRFAITTMDTYYLYGALFGKLLNYSKKNPLHSEIFIANQLKKNNIKWHKINFYFMRVRVQGNISQRDKSFIKYEDK